MKQSLHFNLVSLSGKDLDQVCGTVQEIIHSAPPHSTLTTRTFILNQIFGACSCLLSAELPSRKFLIQIELCWAALSVARNL